WDEMPLTLDFKEATKIDPPRRRGRNTDPPDNDLKGRWALAQAEQFAILEMLTPDWGFFGFAREATNRKYNQAVPPLDPSRAPPPREQEHRRLYEMTTGATALAESLALRRLLGSSPEHRDKRSIDISQVPGIDIAEHPWEKMMAGKKPEP